MEIGTCVVFTRRTPKPDAHRLMKSHPNAHLLSVLKLCLALWQGLTSLHSKNPAALHFEFQWVAAPSVRDWTALFGQGTLLP